MRETMMSDSKKWMPPLLAAVAAMAALATTPARPTPVLCAGDWKKVANEGPAKRYGTRLAYDSARRRIVLFGGYDVSNLRLGDTWEWDGGVWTQVASDGPHARGSHGMAFDTVSRKVVIFGGAGQPGNPNLDNDDTWEWDGVTWRDVSDVDKRPHARNSMGFAYDILRQKVVLFGGGIVFVGERLGDTWAHDVDWRKRPLAGGPSGRLATGMAFDREHGVVVQYNATEFCTDPGTWTWNGDTWSQSLGAQPSTRHTPGMAYDSARHRAVLYGGNDCTGSGQADTWEWDGTDWQQVATTGPGPRTTGPAIAYDRDIGKVVLFGGIDHDPRKAMQDTWLWSGPTYRCDVAIAGDINCDGIVDVDDGRIIVSGRGKPACAADDTRDLNADGHIDFTDKHLLDAMCTFADCARSDGTVDDE
jgi:hypothetical protein